MSPNYKKLATTQELIDFVNTNNKSVLFFQADWAEECLQVEEILKAISKQHPQITFYSIDAENLPDIAVTYDVSLVPTVVVIEGKRQIAKIEGYDIQEIQNLSSKLTSAAQRQPTRQPVSPAILSSPPELGREALNTKLKALVNEAAVMTFIKGTPNMPRCKFSRRLVDILNENNIIFGYFDILSDEQVRQGLKEFSNWPTYPQLYIKGELVGGIDIVQEMVDNEELLECVPSESIRA